MTPSPLVLFLPSAALFLLALVLFVPRRLFAQRASRAEGTVVGHAAHRARRHRRVHPIVEYEVEGSTHRITGTIGETTARYQIGTPVIVLFPANYPAAGRIDAAVELYFGAIVFAIVALVALVCGFGFLFTNR